MRDAPCSRAPSTWMPRRPCAAATRSASRTSIDHVTALTAKSLLQRDEASGRTRFRLLETVRHYAAEQLLLVEGELEATRMAHCDHYVELAERTEAQLFGPRQRQAFERLAADLDNFRAALKWSTERPERGERGLRLAGVARSSSGSRVAPTARDSTRRQGCCRPRPLPVEYGRKRCGRQGCWPPFWARVTRHSRCSTRHSSRAASRRSLPGREVSRRARTARVLPQRHDECSAAARGEHVEDATRSTTDGASPTRWAHSARSFRWLANWSWPRRPRARRWLSPATRKMSRARAWRCSVSR